MTRRRPSVGAVLVVLGLVSAACGGGASHAQGSPTPATGTMAPTATPERVELTIYGAASLKGVLEQVASAYAAAEPRTTITVSTDSTAALETQIEQGAPADVFLSADTKNPQKLIDDGFADGAPTVFATNLLTIIVPAGNPAAVESPKDLGRANVKVIAAGDEVPITTYATQLIANLGSLPGYAADFAAAYASNVVSKEDNVKNVVAKIELGEGDAAVVYVTDAKASTKVETVEVPPAANVPATYSGVVVKASTHPEAAAAFLAWFAGADGQAILATFGFAPGGAKPPG